jgi:hypothetical protein
MRLFGISQGIDRRARRGWFAETLVVLGILAFAFFAMTLQGPQATPIVPAATSLFGIG